MELMNTKIIMEVSRVVSLSYRSEAHEIKNVNVFEWTSRDFSFKMIWN